MLAQLGLATLFLLSVLAAGCSGEANSEGDGRLRVVATIAPVGAIAAAVGGDLIALTTLVRPGTDPHDYEVTPADRRALAHTTLILRNGLGLDDFVTQAVGGNGYNTFEISAGVNVRSVDRAPDPHVWHDIANVQLMSANVVRAFARADPPNAERYEANGAALSRRLEAADAEIRTLVESIPPGDRKMVTNHDAFGYFIERYGLTFVGAVIPNTSTQSEPSAKELAALVDTIRRENVKAIFAESSLDPKVARQLAQDTGVKIVDDLYGDSLGPPGSGADTIEGMLLSNARKIAGALR